MAFVFESVSTADASKAKAKGTRLRALTSLLSNEKLASPLMGTGTGLREESRTKNPLLDLHRVVSVSPLLSIQLIFRP
jgi:hypothetical protein